MAVEVLDDLVATLVRENRGKIPRDFLDWIADKMTPYLEAVALDYFAERSRRGTSTVQEYREWVVGICQWRLDQKMKGMDPFAARHSPQADSAGDTHATVTRPQPCAQALPTR